MIHEKAKKIYRTLLFVCAVYFMSVTVAHQIGTKLPMLYIFYHIPSERYQDLIISFLSLGWAMLFGIGYTDNKLQPKIQIPILSSGVAAICGLIRARMEIRFHNEIDYEIISLAILLVAMITAYGLAVKKKLKA